jgi:hypothetical protein
MDAQKFTQLCTRLAAVDLFGSLPPAPPWAQPGATPVSIKGAIDAARNAVPLVFADAYIDPLQTQLARVIGAGDPAILETLVGAVAQHDEGYPMAPPLNRFLAVVSNLLRSRNDR